MGIPFSSLKYLWIGLWYPALLVESGWTRWFTMSIPGTHFSLDCKFLKVPLIWIVTTSSHLVSSLPGAVRIKWLNNSSFLHSLYSARELHYLAVNSEAEQPGLLYVLPSVLPLYTITPRWCLKNKPCVTVFRTSWLLPSFTNRSTTDFCALALLFGGRGAHWIKDGICKLILINLIWLCEGNYFRAFPLFFLKE